jgi:spore germination cell wall hydrolase CwlJ-like protein
MEPIQRKQIRIKTTKRDVATHRETVREAGRTRKPKQNELYHFGAEAKRTHL